MKKLIKFFALSLVLTLVFGMAVSAASPNTQNTNVIADAQERMSATANESLSTPAGVTATISAAQDNQVYNVLDKVADPVVLSSLGVTVKDVVYVFDIKADRNNTTMSFKVPHVKKDSSYALLHMNDDGTVKEILPAACNNDGWITATFTTYSIYAIIEISSDSNVVPVLTVAPKTGEKLSLAGMVAVILLAGTFVCAKKMRFQR